MKFVPGNYYRIVNERLNISNMKPFVLIAASVMYVALLACNGIPSKPEEDSLPFRFKGVIQKTGVTSYMYGSHTIKGDGKTYALQSTTVNLDLYNNKNVTIKGLKVDGYPVDSGPELIDVKVVEE